MEISNIAYCPHCGNTTTLCLIHTQHYYERMWFSDGDGDREDVPWSSFIASCATCNQVLVYDNPGNNIEDHKFSKGELLYPRVPFPYGGYVPEKITRSYEEASRIKQISPNAFAVLIRRTLEILCNECGIAEGSLANRLKVLSDTGRLPPVLLQATGLLRLIGNIGAHSSAQSVHPLHVSAIDEFFLAIVEYLYVAPHKIVDFQRRLEALKTIDKAIDLQPDEKIPF